MFALLVPGRGQAIAPTMPMLHQPAKRVHSRGDGLSSPWGGAESCLLGYFRDSNLCDRQQSATFYIVNEAADFYTLWN